MCEVTKNKKIYNKNIPFEKMPKGRKKGGKGGNRTFAYSADDIKKADDRAKKKAEARAQRRKDCDDDSSDSSDSDSDEERVTIEQMRAMAQASKPKEFKPKGSASVLGDEIQNTNKGRKANVKMKDLDAMSRQKDPSQMSRKEREAAEKARKKREYMERHMRGETEEARKDLERLKLIRARRAREAQRKKEEEGAAKKRQTQKKEDSDSEEEGAYSDLTSREIKKMNPAKLKEELKLRGQPIQGNKKALQKRLLDWCKENQK